MITPRPKAQAIRGELRALIHLAMPLALTQLGTMLLGMVDSAVVGRLGSQALAAVGLGNTIFFTISILGFGWMLALDPLISQAFGAGERERGRTLMWQGLWAALLATLPLALFTLTAGAGLERMGIEPALAAETRLYLFARLPGLLPFLALTACRAFLQAQNVTRPLVVGVVVANILNLPLDIALVFGVASLGIPALGPAGAGIASSVATLVQLIVAALAVRGLWEGARGYHAPERALILRVLRLGTPIALTLFTEMGSIAIIGVLMGNLGTLALSSHTVALQLASASFQVALALGASAAIRVGQAVGRGDTSAARLAGLTAITTGGAVMLLGSVAFLLIPGPLARIITDEPAVIAAAIPLLAVAAAFQLSDGVQAVAAGALRGAGDTKVPLLANLLGHYGIGVPLGAALAFSGGLGAQGLWWGLSAGLTMVATMLAARFASLSRRHIARA